MTLVGQTIPAARACLPLPAGIFRMAPSRFVLGAAMWNGAFLAFGYMMRLSA